MSDDAPAEDAELHPVVEMLQTITPGVIRQNFAIKFGLVLLVMGLFVIAVGYVATTAVTGQTEQNVESEFLGDAGQQADIVQQWVEANSLQVEIQSDKGDYHAPDPDDVTAELRGDIDRSAGEVHALHVLEDNRTEGLTLFASSDDSWDTPLPLVERADTDEHMNDREWILEAAGGTLGQEILALGTNDVFVSETYIADGVPVVAFISPSADDDNRYLFKEVTVSVIQNSLRGGADADEDIGFTQVVNTGSYFGDDGRTNTVMMDARPEDDNLLGLYSDRVASIEVLERANELRGEPDRAGVIGEMDPDEAILDEVYTVGYAPVESNDWVVVAHGPRSEIFGFVDTVSRYGLGVTILTALLITLTGALLGYSIATSIDRLTHKTEAMREGDLDVDLETTRVDNIGRLYVAFDEMRDALKEQIRESERARKEAEVARAEAESLAEYLRDKATEYSEIMQQVGAGDLTQRMSKDGDEESMDRIADEFNAMIEELEKTTGQLKSYVDEVEESGADVEHSAKTVRESSEDVAESISRIATDAQSQQERLENVGETMDGLADRLESIQDSHPDVDIDEPLEQIASVTDDVAALAEVSEETLVETEAVAGASQEQAAVLTDVSDRAHKLQQYAQPLRDILQRFETEAEHEFVFSVGPTGGAASPSSRDGDED